MFALLQPEGHTLVGASAPARPVNDVGASRRRRRISFKFRSLRKDCVGDAIMCNCVKATDVNS